jgi:hypothetical protein
MNKHGRKRPAAVETIMNFKRQGLFTGKTKVSHGVNVNGEKRELRFPQNYMYYESGT